MKVEDPVIIAIIANEENSDAKFNYESSYFNCNLELVNNDRVLKSKERYVDLNC